MIDGGARGEGRGTWEFSFRNHILIVCIGIQRVFLRLGEGFI